MPREIFKLFGTIAVNGLNNVSGALKTIDSQFKQADKALTKFARQSVSIGTSLTKNVTAPIAAVAVGIGALALSTSKYADNVLDLEQVTGLSTDTIQELENVVRQAGGDFEGFISVISKLSNSMPEIIKGSGPASAAIKKLGVNVLDSSGHVKKMDLLFPELLDKLRNVQNITERNALAQDIFGKSLKEIAPILGMTTKQMEEAQKQAHDLGLVMSNESLVAADNFGVEVRKLQGQFQAFLRDLSSGFIPILRDSIIPLIQSKVIPAFQGLANSLKSIIAWFQGLNENTKKTTIIIIGVVAAVGPAILIFGKAVLMIKALTVAFTIARTAAIGLTLAMVTNPFLAVIAVVGVLTLALLGAKIAKDALNTSFDKEIITADTVAIELNIKAIEARKKSLMDLRNELIKNGKSTKDVDIALFDLVETERKAKLTAAELAIENGNLAKSNKVLTEEEIKAQQKFAETWKETSEEIGKTELELNELKRNLDLEDAKSKKATAETILNINKVYDERGLKILENEKKKAEQYDNEKVESAGETQKSIDDLNEEYSKKLLEQSGDKVGILELEKVKAIKIAKEKGIDILKIEKYYDKKIQEARDELANKEKKYLGGSVNDWLGALQTLGSGIADLFSMSADAKMTEIDNWEAAERAAIERGLGSEISKRNQLEALDLQAEQKRKELRKKSAAQSKNAAIFDAIMGTGVAVIGALGMKPWTPFNFILAGIVGALGIAKTAMIASQPLPLAKGALIKGGRGGVTGLIGEGSEDELITPMESGASILARKIMEASKRMFSVGTPGFAMAGAGGYSSNSEVHYHIGTLIADERGLKELTRRQARYVTSESQRRGN